MEPNGEGQPYPEEERPMRPSFIEDEPGFTPLGQEPAEDNEFAKHSGQNLPEEEKIEQAH